MAERQSVVRWIRQFVAPILAAGVAAIAVTSLTAGSITGGVIVQQPTVGVVSTYQAVLGLKSEYLNAVPTLANTEQALGTYNLPADIMANLRPGAEIRLRIWGTANANANSKQVRVRIGATGIAGQAMAVCDWDASETTWAIDVWIVRQTEDGFIYFWECDGASANDLVSNTATTYTEELDIPVVVTANNVTSAADSRVQSWAFEWIP